MKLLRCDPRGHIFNQIIATLVSSFLCLSVGMTFGITAVLLPSLKEDKNFPYDKQYISWIASVSPLAMIVGCLTSGTLLDILGRRKCFILLALPIMVGWILIGSSRNSFMLMGARIIAGIGAGAVRPMAMTFIGEISDPKYRGITLFSPSLAANLGVIICHITSKFVHWRTNVYLCVIPSILCFIGCIFVKESPLWLISKGRSEEGQENFKWYRGNDEKAQRELNAALEKHKTDSQKSQSSNEVLSLICSTAFLKPISKMFLLFLVVQYCGVNTLSFYAQDILKSTFGDNIDAYLLMLCIDVLRCIGSLTICVFGKFITRKKAFTFCAFGTITMLVILVIFLCLDPPGLMWIPITALIFYVGLSSPVISLAWSFVAEIFPGKLRGIGSGMSSSLSFLLLFISVQVTPTIIDKLGVQAMYGSFAVVTFTCTVILAFVLPETHGLSLQEIEEMSNKKSKTETRQNKSTEALQVDV